MPQAVACCFEFSPKRRRQVDGPAFGLIANSRFLKKRSA